jgi:N-formylglutamate deformylase
MMNSTFNLHQGSVPLLISMPHNGEEIPSDVALHMTDNALKVEDTDWYKDRLYDFAESLGAYIIKPTYNRYVIDLNRDPNGVDLYPGANSTELCPTTAFDLSPLYLDGSEPSAQEIKRRIKHYWQPYHQALALTLKEIKERFGKAVLLEAHSIRSTVPRFFEGQLPDFNFGNSEGKSCSSELIQQISTLNYAPYSTVTNGRFKGGYITRHYGNPAENVHALQLELSQRTYMNEQTLDYDVDLAEQVKPKLRNLVNQLIQFAQQ